MPQSMRKRQRIKVVMVIDNEIVRDARVLRAAGALRDYYDLTIVGLDRGDFEINREQHRRNYGLDLRWVRLGISKKLPKNAPGYFVRGMELFVKMVAQVISLRPQVIHAHEQAGLIVALAVRALMSTKVIYDAHELYPETVTSSRFWWRKFLDRLGMAAMRYCDEIIACNQHRAWIMWKEYGAPFLPAVIRNIPPFHKYEPTTVLREQVQKQNPNIKRICLYQGKIGSGRGLDVLVRALKILPRDVGMVLVGDGIPTYLESLDRLAHELGVVDRFVRLPPVDHADLFRITCSADVGIVIYQNNCRNNYYCAPNKLYEYAAAGLPTVGSNQPPIREFVERYSCGSLFEPNSPEQLARAVRNVLDDTARYAKFKLSALAAAKIECWENESKRLLSIYEQLLARNGPVKTLPNRGAGGARGCPQRQER